MPSFVEMLKTARRYSKEDNIKTSKRFLEILSIVKRHDLISGLTPEKAVDLLEDLGPTFVKLGQIASTHPDVIPQEYCDAFGSLRTSVRPLEFGDVKAAVEAELERPLEELFTEFDEEPLGSASIAQVHRAVASTGETVAVKVQRPGIVETVTLDLAIMERLVDLYDLVRHEGESLSVKDLVAEIVKTSTEELDFMNEAANLDRFYANNKEREGISSPRCFRAYTTSAILTEDFVDAPDVGKIDSMDLSEAAREKLAYLIAENYLQQIMEDGFYHADPHAGNVLVTGHNSIEWIDFGMMGTLTRSQREQIEEIILAMVKGDAYGLKRSLLRVVTPTGAIDHAALLEACEQMTERFIDVDLEGFDTAALLNSMVESLNEAGFEIDPFVTNLARGLVTLEGTIQAVSPKLNIMQVLGNYLTKSFDFSRIEKKMRRIAGQGIESVGAMAGLPAKISETLDMVQKGHVKVGMELSSTEKFGRDIRAAGGLLAIALVAMGVVIGACVLGYATQMLQIGGIPIFGLAGIIFGVGVAIYILTKVHPHLK